MRFQLQLWLIILIRRVVFLLALHWPFATCVYNSIFGLQLQERRLGALPRLDLAGKDSVGAEQSLHILVEGDLEDVLDDGLGGVEGEAHELGRRHYLVFLYFWGFSCGFPVPIFLSRFAPVSRFPGLFLIARLPVGCPGMCSAGLAQSWPSIVSLCASTLLSIYPLRDMHTLLGSQPWVRMCLVSLVLTQVWLILQSANQWNHSDGREPNNATRGVVAEKDTGPLRIYQNPRCQTGRFTGPLTAIMWDTLTRMTDISVSPHPGEAWDMYLPCRCVCVCVCA